MGFNHIYYKGLHHRNVLLIVNGSQNPLLAKYQNSSRALLQKCIVNFIYCPIHLTHKTCIQVLHELTVLGWRVYFRHTNKHQFKGLPSSLKVNRPIWGKSLKVSRQMVPAVLKRAMHTWSCFTKRGRVLLFSPDFLSTKQIKAYPR